MKLSEYEVFKFGENKYTEFKDRITQFNESENEIIENKYTKFNGLN